MIVLNVDGEDAEPSNSSSGLMVELNNLSRGQHTVMATVIDEDGNILIKTEPVTFQVLRVVGGWHFLTLREDLLSQVGRVG